MTDFVMPKAGITMDEGTVVSWLIQVGDAFKEGQSIATVETDKSTIDVNANEDGVLLEILVPAGTTVPVGTPIARLGRPGERAEASAPPAPAPRAAGARMRISPLARRMAAERGVALEGLAGTGPGGRILRRDVEAAAAARRPATAPAPPAPSGAGRRVALTRMRRTIAERMTQSATTIPQFRVSREVDVTRTLAAREALLPLQVKLSVTDFLVQACALALTEHPGVNASFAGAEVIQHEQVNIGLAVAIEGGLVVPVIRDAARLSLLEIGRQREALVAAARSGKLMPDQLTGGTFTISNLGAFGVDSFDAIVNPPEAAILAVGQVVRKPVVAEDGTVVVRPMLSLTVTADHRVLDGADAARFLGSIAAHLTQADQFRLA